MARRTFLLGLAAWGAVASGHNCIHDKLLSSSPQLRDVGAAPAAEITGRRLVPAVWTPLRITTRYDSGWAGAGVSTALQDFVQNTLIPAAVSRWQQALLVDTSAVTGNLLFSRKCLYRRNSDGQCTQYEAYPACDATDGSQVNVSSTLLAQQEEYPSSGSATTTLPGGTGLPSTDFGLFVTVMNTTVCGQGGSGTLAYAYTCNRDSWGRPTWGRINMCPGQLSLSNSSWASQYSVALHELAHALGFSASSWPLFVDPVSKTPLTPPDPLVPTRPRPASNFSISYSCSGSPTTAFIPANNTVAYFAERGMAQCNPFATPTGIYPPSNCVAKFVTPKVTAAARAYFNCSTLNGAELENQLTTACDLQGSHWEQRLLSTELMASYAQHIMKLSPLTLAVFEDSGWYTANYSVADWFRRNSDYGYQQGCAFATDKCLNGAGVGTGSPAHFYSTSHDQATGNSLCTTDNLAVAFTGVATYTQALPAQYEYFADPDVGGTYPDTFDFCPAVQAYSNVRCTHAEDANQFSFYYGAAYGPTSACVASTLIWQGVTRNNVPVTAGPGANCYDVYCADAGTLQIKVTAGRAQGCGATVTCTAATVGHTFTPAGYVGNITCPDPATICGSAYQYAGAGVPAVSTPAPWPFPAVAVAVPSPACASIAPSAVTPSASPSSGASSLSVNVALLVAAAVLSAVALLR